MAHNHQNTHEIFVEKVLALKAQETTKSFDDVVDEIVAFLTHWLALHIIDADKRMAKAVLAVERGATVAEAKVMAQKSMAGDTRAMIETVMSMYDRLASDCADDPGDRAAARGRARTREGP